MIGALGALALELRYVRAGDEGRVAERPVREDVITHRVRPGRAIVARPAVEGVVAEPAF